MRRGSTYCVVAQVAAAVCLSAAAVFSSGCGETEVKAAPSAPPPVNVILPTQRQVQEYDEFNGRVAAVESLDIRSRVSGYIESVGFKDGELVKKGQLLFQIDPRPFQAELDQAQAVLGQAQAEADYAKREIERIEPLAKTGSASPLELSKTQDMVDRSKASIAKAKADIERKKLDLDYASVKSPIDGRVSQTQFTAGNLVGGDTLLTNVVSVSPIYVNIDVDERRLLQYRAEAREKGSANLARIRDANLPVLIALANETDFPHKGIIEFIDNRVDPLTGTIRVRAELDNSKGYFTPGQFVRVRFPRGGEGPSLLVPDRAISRDQDRKFVLKVNDKNVVEYQAVEIGGVFGDERAITKGLTAGEKIVVDGLQRARPGQPVTPTLIDAAPATQPTTSPK